MSGNQQRSTPEASPATQPGTTSARMLAENHVLSQEHGRPYGQVTLSGWLHTGSLPTLHAPVGYG
ncbi:protein of unknown function (plasmid) [Paraburkholderia dioscoreae]|uniref:Uncharacterized protein n=1 Tax=Paraburkholderia dioscoreae TaxID=2604047 RepID=A0A5Q4ZLF0_9BURK|nr:protein of unknown function [Paraburkholderia dioscoreae]